MIVNPVAGKGRAKQVLPKIQAYLTKHALPYTVHMTESQGDGVRCAKQALAEGCDRVLAVGG
ncbi:MAG: diacylglycerol/lipid kinase family protein, partial [Christensenellales bacterium]